MTPKNKTAEKSGNWSKKLNSQRCRAEDEEGAEGAGGGEAGDRAEERGIPKRA